MTIFNAMNTQFLLEGFPEEYCLMLEDRAREYERKFTRFNKGSELSLLNCSRTGIVSDDMVRCLKDAWAMYVETKGHFNPFIGYMVESMGYVESFDLLVTHGETVEDAADEVHDSSISSFDGNMDRFMRIDGNRVELMGETKLDLGGFAKGWAASELMKAALSDGYRNFMIDAGGDICSSGINPRGHEWIIGISDPFDPESDLIDLALHDGSCVATSSSMKRRWVHDGKWRNHIIDPFTGRSTMSDIVQVSVFSEKLWVSEAYAKLILLKGTEGLAGIESELAKRRIGFIAVRESGEILENDVVSEYAELES